MDDFKGYQFYREFADTTHEHPLDTFIAVRMDRVETVERIQHEVLGKMVMTRQSDVLYDAVSAVSPRDPDRFRSVKVSERYLQLYTEPVPAGDVYQLQPSLPLYLDLNPATVTEDGAAGPFEWFPAGAMPVAVEEAMYSAYNS